MSLTGIKKAAARSAARMKKKPSPQDPQAPAIDPRWEVKTTPRGTLYRVITIPLLELPTFLDREKLDPKTYFHYGPETNPNIKPDPGWVLGVRGREDKETKEL
jgi:hypothetical protein